MNEAARQTLRELVATYGAALAADPRRCEGLLRDFCPDHRREIFVLVSALREGVASDLLAAPRAVPFGAYEAQLRRRLEEHLALTPDAAAWAVESWAVALGAVPPEGLSVEPLVEIATDPATLPASGPDRRSLRPVVAWIVGVAALWALVGASVAALGTALAAALAGPAINHTNWIAAGALGGACLGAFAGALVRTVGGAVGDLVHWLVSGTVGGAALGAALGAAAGGVSAIALEGPSTAGGRAMQWAAIGATLGGLLTTLLGAAAWRPAESVREARSHHVAS